MLSEAEEDDILMKRFVEEDEEDKASSSSSSSSSSSAGASVSRVIFERITEQPSCIEGKMKHYQIEGLNWLYQLHCLDINGILADEMGLGKTLQTISILAYLQFEKNIPGPHLVICPRSTLDNWFNEVKKWYAVTPSPPSLSLLLLLLHHKRLLSRSIVSISCLSSVVRSILSISYLSSVVRSIFNLCIVDLSIDLSLSLVCLSVYLSISNLSLCLCSVYLYIFIYSSIHLSSLLYVSISLPSNCRPFSLVFMRLSVCFYSFD